MDFIQGEQFSVGGFETPPIDPRYDDLGSLEKVLISQNLDPIKLSRLEAPSGSVSLSAPDRYRLEYLLQDWLWLSALQAFEKATEIPMNPYRRQLDIQSQNRTTAWLCQYTREALIRQVYDIGLPLNFKVGETAFINLPQLQVPCVIKRIVDCLNCEVEFNGISNSMNVAFLLKKETASDLTLDNIRDLSMAASTYDLQQSIRLFQALPAQKASMGDYEAARGSLWAGTGAREKAASNLAFVQDILRDTRTLERSILSFERAAIVDVLCESLACALETIYGQRSKAKGPTFIGDELDMLANKRNWCPARTTKILWTQTTTRSLLLATFDPHDTRKHTDCMTHLCKEPVSLEHGHLFEGCQCDFAPIPENNVIEVLKTSNGVPGIRRRSIGSQLEYTVCDISSIRYVAISHVWAHGMGNSTQNKIYTCRIESVFACVEQLTGSTDNVVWLDTICVPLERKWRKIAIHQMSTIYKKAWRTLVMDRKLMQVEGSWLELRLQLLASEWQRRLWTMQEGRLSEHVYIQYKLGPISADELYNVSYNANSKESDGEVLHMLREATGHLNRDLFCQPADFRDYILQLVQDLAFRDTSKIEDEATCLAILLGIPIDKFEMLPSMAELILSLSFIPRNLLFLPAPRLTIPSLRWAPSSITGHRTFVSTVLSGDETTCLTEDGLMAQMDCIQLEDRTTFFRDRKFPDLHFIMDGGVAKYTMKIVDEYAPPIFALQSSLILLGKDTQFMGSGCSGVIVSVQYREGKAIRADNGGFTVEPIQEMKDLVHYCHYEYRVNIEAVNEYTRSRVTQMIANRQGKRREISGKLIQRSWFCID